jgi:hypothetical protein
VENEGPPRDGVPGMKGIGHRRWVPLNDGSKPCTAQAFWHVRRRRASGDAAEGRLKPREGSIEGGEILEEGTRGVFGRCLLVCVGNSAGTGTSGELGIETGSSRTMERLHRGVATFLAKSQKWSTDERLLRRWVAKLLTRPSNDSGKILPEIYVDVRMKDSECQEQTQASTVANPCLSSATEHTFLSLYRIPPPPNAAPISAVVLELVRLIQTALHIHGLYGHTGADEPQEPHDGLLCDSTMLAFAIWKRGVARIERREEDQDAWGMREGELEQAGAAKMMVDAMVVSCGSGRGIELTSVGRVYLAGPESDGVAAERGVECALQAGRAGYQCMFSVAPSSIY